MADIELRGVQTNNLQNLDVNFPEKQITVVTGVSGSGKSSLVFDTLYAESYRRYVESLSSFARQYLKALPKPSIASVKNLPPAIAVKQSKSGANSRSTVGTITELNDLVRIIFTHASKVFCENCERDVIKEDGTSIATEWMKKRPQAKVLLLAPLKRWKQSKTELTTVDLEGQGFSRLWSEKAGLHRTSDVKKLNCDDLYVVVDRVVLNDEQSARTRSSLDLCLKLGKGLAAVLEESQEAKGLHFHSNTLQCPSCETSFLAPSNALLSFNHPLGACKTCQGFGQAQEIDWNKVFPDQESSLSDSGVAAWNFGSHVALYDDAKKSAQKFDIDFRKTFKNYTDSEWRWLKYGDKGRFDGVEGYFKWLDSHRHKTHYRIHASRFRKYVTCPECNGKRLQKLSLACMIHGESIADICTRSVDSLREWVGLMRENAQKSLIATRVQDARIMGIQEALEEVDARLDYLQRVGVGYLCMDRQTRTLSGGELQRISMARCLGGGLVDTLYCLDEPTSGLHARDSRRLMSVVQELKNQGNTVVVVEHERTLIEAADHLIEIGPEAGHKGGHMTFAGTPAQRSKTTKQEWTSSHFKPGKFLEVKGASTHNLKTIDIKIPLGALTSVCGVSGSGKTSLIQHTLYPLLAQLLGSETEGWVAIPKATGIFPKDLKQQISFVMHVSQASMGRSTRSNIATYLGIFDEIRKLMSQTPVAVASKLMPGDFSFNTSGGRCEECRGLGTVIEDLSFLGEMAVTCSACQGRRFSDKVLKAEYKGKNLIDILSLTVSQAREFFFEKNALCKALDSVVEMGLGYVSLGQNTSSFSGGEAQRLKLLRLMKDHKGGKPGFLIFDEPTTGLSDKDVSRLIEQLRALTKKGHTVLVVEHHLGVLKSSDWLIEIGPEAAHAGGNLVFQGSPSEISKSKGSLTAEFLM